MSRAKSRAAKSGQTPAARDAAAQDVSPASSAATTAIREEGGRLLVRVRVTPRAATEGIALEGGALRVRVTAPPVEGAANAAVIALLARRLHVPKRAISILRGASAREKLVTVEGIGEAELRACCAP
ncbi:MAG TPA: DUF167 domain-containing protein [Ktedonobacterales bacterium]|nr:DUF167 domain-containing protein [Ktedonobacterales bacterium]